MSVSFLSFVEEETSLSLATLKLLRAIISFMKLKLIAVEGPRTEALVADCFPSRATLKVLIVDINLGNWYVVIALVLALHEETLVHVHVGFSTLVPARVAAVSVWTRQIVVVLLYPAIHAEPDLACLAVNWAEKDLVAHAATEFLRVFHWSVPLVGPFVKAQRVSEWNAESGLQNFG